MKSAGKLTALLVSAVLVFCAFPVFSSGASNRLPCITCPADKDPSYKDHFVLSTWSNCPYWFDYYLYYYDQHSNVCLMGINQTGGDNDPVELYFTAGTFEMTGAYCTFLVFRPTYESNGYVLVDSNKFGWYPGTYFYDNTERWEAPKVENIIYCNLDLIDGSDYSHIVREADTTPVQNFPFGEAPTTVYYYIYSKDWVANQSQRVKISTSMRDSRGDPFPNNTINEFAFIPTNDPDGDYIYSGSCIVDKSDLISSDGAKQYALNFYNQGIFVDHYLGTSCKFGFILTQYNSDLDPIDTQLLYNYESDKKDSFHIYDAEPGDFIYFDLSLPFLVNDVDSSLLTFTWYFQGEEGLYFFPGNALLQSFSDYAQSTIINNLNQVNNNIKALPGWIVDSFVDSQVVSLNQFLSDHPDYPLPPTLDPAISTTITINKSLENNLKNFAFGLPEYDGSFDDTIDDLNDKLDRFTGEYTPSFQWVKNRIEDIIDTFDIELLLFVILSFGMAVYAIGRRVKG